MSLASPSSPEPWFPHLSNGDMIVPTAIMMGGHCLTGIELLLLLVIISRASPDPVPDTGPYFEAL